MADDDRRVPANTFYSGWRHAGDAWRMDGIRGLCRHGLLYAGQRLANVHVFVGMTLEQADLPEVFRVIPPPYSTKLLTADAVDVPGLDRDFQQRAIQQHNECLMVFCDGNPVSWAWYSDRPTNFSDGLEASFAQNFRYVYNGYTRPAHRGRRLHAYGMAAALQHYSSRGCRGLICYVDAANFRSLRSTLRVGYKIVGRVVVGGLPRKFVWRSPGCAAYGLTVAHTD